MELAKGGPSGISLTVVFSYHKNNHMEERRGGGGDGMYQEG
jgi:hypothetical protein